MIIEISETAKLPTQFGMFDIISFKEIETLKEHFVVSIGDVREKENVVLRVHSECLTGDTFFSKKCDCGDQLKRSLEMISKVGSGMIIYLRQEGRGIGLFNKINAYALQDKGQNTHDANLSLGYAVDNRNYFIVKKVTEFYKIKSIHLISNNPDKSNALAAMGIKVSEIIPVIIEHNTHSHDYLEFKKNNMNHKL
ncbi:MAG: GTP cyclohydrolase II [Saprospiraceae bacterium]|jgi:3,4-dihydroxy 2-butanone 4-phosphate synthase/GTP cyclohydrolase II|nr:GTP cyclohydrolase II [Saprospiraceae bacterium]